MKKSCKNPREMLCSSKGKIEYVVGKQCNTLSLRVNICSVPKDNKLDSLQSGNYLGEPEKL